MRRIHRGTCTGALALLLLLSLATPAHAYRITGPDSDGRYQTTYQPAVAAALPASLEVRIAFLRSVGI